MHVKICMFCEFNYYENHQQEGGLARDSRKGKNKSLIGIQKTGELPPSLTYSTQAHTYTLPLAYEKHLPCFSFPYYFQAAQSPNNNRQHLQFIPLGEAK